jgi:aminopeptidase N
MKKIILIFLCFIYVNISLSQWINDGSKRPRSYDVQHMLIKSNFDEPNKTIFGECTITMQPLNDKFKEFELDAIAMNIDYVKLASGKNLKYESIYNNRGLKIILDKEYKNSEKIIFTVKYSAQPKSGMYFVQPDSINPNRRWQIWTQGQGRGNDNWFPCFNHFSDKTTTETITTVKDNYEVLSNGKLISVKHDKKNRTKTFHWKMAHPHSTYLVMLGIGEYHIIKDSYKDIPVEYYVYPEQIEDAKRSLGLTPDMIAFFEKATGTLYPFEKYAQICLNNFMFGGMENTTATTLNDKRNIINQRAMLDYQPTSIVAHELAHQWYGDFVTAIDDSSHWLQEGFATYFDALYHEHLLGKEEFRRIMDENFNRYKADEARQGKTPLHWFPARYVYVKGASVLHMLRFVLGDEDFFKAVALYTNRFAYNVANTHDFIEAVKDATGKDLQWFFYEWLFKASYPHLNVSYVYDETSKTLKLNVTQTHEVSDTVMYFRMPVDIEITTANEKNLHRITFEKADETFEIQCDSKPLNVIFDKGNWIVKNITFEKSIEELIYQLKNAELAYDRKTAAEALRKYANNETVFNALYESGLNDEFWQVRLQSAHSDVVFANSKGKELLIKMLKDVKSSIRTEAVKLLADFKESEIANFEIANLLFDRIKNDSSYYVVANSFVSLAQIEGEKVLDIIVKYSKQESFFETYKFRSIVAFKMIDTPESIEAIVPFTKLGEEYFVREFALTALSECKSDKEKVKFILSSLLNDKDTRIISKAKELLEKI